MALAVYLAGLMIAGSISYYFLADHAWLVIAGGLFIALYDLLGLWLQQRRDERMAKVAMITRRKIPSAY
jgi:membrane protein YdbS with pleckstrin-like domain